MFYVLASNIITQNKTPERELELLLLLASALLIQLVQKFAETLSSFSIFS